VRRLVVVLAAALALPATLTVALPAGLASAATPVIVACKGYSGSFTSTGVKATATKCNQATITGGSGKETAGSTGTPFSIKWKTGETAKGTSTAKKLTTSKCPAAFASEYSTKFTVTGGTATALKGGKTTDLLCASATGTFEVLPGTTFKI
jgi:hypothetical protein